jgi:HK97 family phage portal protein
VGLVASLFRANSPSFLDDRFFGNFGADSASGIKVSPDSALRANAVYCCVQIRAETIASLPLIVYRRLPDGGKERAPNHPAYRLLHDRPNQWQTGFEWREMMQGHLDLRGNAYSRILPGPSGPIDQLIPLHPDRVTPTLYTDGSIDYEVRKLDGNKEMLQPWQILHLRGWTQDGVKGMSPIALHRETVGIDLAAQDYAARSLRNDISPSLALKHPAVLDPEAYNRLRDSMQEQNTGANRGKALILEENMSIEKLGMTNKDAQFIEARKYTKSELAAIYRIPPHMIGLLDRATHSNIEHQGIEFTIYTVLPIARRWESIIARDLFFPLFDDSSEYFAEFLLDGLNRGDQPSRYTAYAIGRNWGWLSANDVRRLENMNSIGAQGDEYLRPLNMTIEGAPQAKQLADGTPADNSADTLQDDSVSGDGEAAKNHRTRLFALAESAAGRMARKEAAAMKRLLTKHRKPEADMLAGEAFCFDMLEFYKAHTKVLSDSLRIPEAASAQFCADNTGLLSSAARAGNWSLLEATIVSNEGRARHLAQIAMEVIQ